MRPLSVRVDDETYASVERLRIDAGQSRTDWLRGLISQAVERGPTLPPPAPEAVQFCTHPESKRLGSLCVGCGADVGVLEPV